MGRVDIGDDVAVSVLILEEECTEVGLATVHHVLDGSGNLWVSDDDGLVESCWNPENNRQLEMGREGTRGQTSGTDWLVMEPEFVLRGGGGGKSGGRSRESRRKPVWQKIQGKMLLDSSANRQIVLPSLDSHQDTVKTPH